MRTDLQNRDLTLIRPIAPPDPPGARSVVLDVALPDRFVEDGVERVEAMRISGRDGAGCSTISGEGILNFGLRFSSSIPSRTSWAWTARNISNAMT